jgi:hypothetical protein
MMRHILRWRYLAVIVGLTLGVASTVAPAGACTLDGQPTASANGRLARLNPHTPQTTADLATWAAFIFTQHFHARLPVTLTEDRRALARVLIAEALRRPWRWEFGDGSTGYGWSVRHTYARPGTWRVTVDAYLPNTKKWYHFDQVMLTVER